MNPKAWLLALGLLSLSATALAGDRLSVTRVAFNADGSRALVMVQGQQDGSGFPVAELHLLNTATGRTWTFRAQGKSEGQSSPQLMTDLLAGQKNTLRQLGYQSGKTSAARYQRPTPATAPTWNEGVGAGQAQQTSVKLWTQAVPITLQVQAAQTPCPHPELLPAGQLPARFTLSVRGQQVAATAVPCAARYSLERVDVKGNRAVFSVRAYTPGFEGPDAQPLFLAVTLR